jgi:hypothetical protein
VTLTPRGKLVAFLERVIPSGEQGDRIKAVVLSLADEYAAEREARADERTAAMIEAHARSPEVPVRRRERGERQREGAS